MMAIRATAFAVGLLGIVLSAAPCLAQSWPQRSVKFIVPFGPGAGADIGARLFADRLSALWGKPVVVENRPGADGLVAITAFVGANDDHILLFAASGSFTVHPYLHEKLPYAAERDLLPIARVSNTILAIGVSDSLKISSLAEFVAHARARPDKLNAAVVPGITEFVFDGFVKGTSLAITKVPYRDIVQAATDVGEGRVQVMMASWAILQPQVQAGRIKVLAVTSREPVPIAPGIPTAAEAGYPALEVEGLVGLFGPRGMPVDLRERIAADVRAVFNADPTIAARLATTGQVVNPGGPAEFATAVKEQRDKVAGVAQALGIRPKQ
jgi:tripartite-type tricarboxylate transporter receptor subunit TctC